MTDTTPAPPTDTDALNRQIAEMRGYTNFETDEYGRHFAVNAIGERWVAPDYAGDPAAALSLLEHVLTLDFEVTSICELHSRAVPWHVRLSRSWNHPAGTPINASACTLTEAIARACRDALLVIKGDTDNGTA